jgi:phospholipid/cholesterol/gamma-HCH transport system ATP-binding protein
MSMDRDDDPRDERFEDDDDRRFERRSDDDAPEDEERFARDPDAETTPPARVVREPGDDEYRWHTGENRPSGAPDAVEFVDVHKSFGRNQILRGLNMGIPEDKISMILGP